MDARNFTEDNYSAPIHKIDIEVLKKQLTSTEYPLCPHNRYTCPNNGAGNRCIAEQCCEEQGEKEGAV